MAKFYTTGNDGKLYFAPTLFGFECCSDDRCDYKEIKNAISSIARFGVGDGFALVCRTDDLRWCVVEGFSSAEDVNEFLEREGISEYFNRMYLCQLHKDVEPIIN